jgi:hypothetical protein
VGMKEIKIRITGEEAKADLFNNLCSSMSNLSIEEQVERALGIEQDNQGFLDFWQFYYLANIQLESEEKTQQGFVYFLQDKTNKNIKIGFTTKDPEIRVAQFRKMNSNPSTILFSIPATRSTESFLHNNLKEFHVHGEWFTGDCLDVAQMLITEARA